MTTIQLQPTQGATGIFRRTARPSGGPEYCRARPPGFWTLRNNIVFDSLADQTIETLLTRATMRRYPAGNIVHRAGERTDTVAFLISGRIKIYNLSNNGKETILGYVYPGQLFGDDGFPDEARYDDSAMAIETARVAQIPRRSFGEILTDDPAVSAAYARFIGNRYRRLTRRLRNYLFLSARDRVQHVLRDLAEECGEPCEQGIRLRYLFSHQEIANQVGSTRETASLAIGELRDAGLIRMDGRRFVLVESKMSK